MFNSDNSKNQVTFKHLDICIIADLTKNFKVLDQIDFF